MPRVDDRRVISGIIFVIRNDRRWRDVPPSYGPHKTIYNRFIRWSDMGVSTSLASPPKAARLSARFHHEDDFSKLVANYQDYLNNLRLCPPPRDGFPPQWRYLTELAALGKRENVPPNLTGDWIRAILTGRTYPLTLLTATLVRLRSDGGGRDMNSLALRAGTLVTEAGATIPQFCAITGHSLPSATRILERYMSMTDAFSSAAIHPFQNASETAFANRLQTT